METGRKEDITSRTEVGSKKRSLIGKKGSSLVGGVGSLGNAEKGAEGGE